MVDGPMCGSGLVSQQFHNRLRGSRRLREVTGVTMPRGRFTEGRLVELQTRVQQDKIMYNAKNNIQFYNRSATCRLTARRHQILQTEPFSRKKPGCSTNVFEAESGQLLYNKGENTVLNVMMFTGYLWGVWSWRATCLCGTTSAWWRCPGTLPGPGGWPSWP